jgi:hypothetical protein
MMWSITTVFLACALESEDFFPIDALHDGLFVRRGHVWDAFLHACIRFGWRGGRQPDVAPAACMGLVACLHVGSFLIPGCDGGDGEFMRRPSYTLGGGEESS